MHDPLTVAFEIRYPWKVYKNPKNDFEKTYREPFITIWHKDPEKDGTDDSCGCFMRSRHGSKKILEKIRSEFEFNWASSWTSDNGNTYYTGYFKPDGSLNMSLHSVVLDLFFRAAFIVFGYNINKTNKYMNKHLAQILHFAENPIDSLHTSLTRKYEIACNEEYDERFKEEWIKSTASIIYGYILRNIRPWYKHPRWHIWHWEIQIHPWQKIRRFLFDKCCICGKGYKWGESPMTNWEGNKIWHSYCDHVNQKPYSPANMTMTNNEVKDIVKDMKVLDIPKQGDI